MRECAHCEPEHGLPNRCAWGVHVDTEVDGDGQPTRLIVQPAGGAHVAQSDADWIMGLIRAAGESVGEDDHTVTVFRFNRGGIGREIHWRHDDDRDPGVFARQLANELNTPVMWTTARVTGVYDWMVRDDTGNPLWRVTWPRGWRERSVLELFPSSEDGGL
jgi:hypothetical protein